MNLDITIDTLELNTLSPVDLERLGAALESELSRLIAQHGPPTAAQDAEILVPPIQLTAQSGADALGVQLAQAIYQGLSENPRLQ